MSNGVVLLLGNVRPGEFEGLVAKGVPLGVVLDQKVSKKTAALDNFQFVLKHDFEAPPSTLRETLTPYVANGKIDCILNLREYHVRQFLAVSDLTGQSSVGTDGALASLDKSAMRRLFVRHLGSSATGRSKAVSNLEEAEQFAAEVGFPVVLKPIDLYGSLFVRRFDSLPEFKIGFTEIQKSVALKSGSTSVKLQIEEFLTGSNHSVECVVDHRGVVSTTPVIDVLTGRDIGREDFHHFARWAPTLLSDKAAAEMKSLAVEACRSLALTATIAHVEFIMTASGPKLLELAVRPGGNRARLLSRIYGIDILHAYYSASVRKPIDVNVRFTKPFAMVSPFPPNRQAYAGLSGESRITSLETYESHKVQVGIGDILGSAAEGFFSPMMIELSSEKIECLRADAHRVATFTDLFIKGDDKL